MAKISARNCHELYSFNTERTIESWLYRERWVMRSDNTLLRRIVWVEHDGKRNTHNSGYSIVCKVKEGTSKEDLALYLHKKGFHAPTS